MSGVSSTIGILEWFRPGEYDRVEQVIHDLQVLGVTQLRTGLSWADWHTPNGQIWYTWLLPRLGRSFQVLPCFQYTPPSLGIAPKVSSPPRHPQAYADCLDELITRFGAWFEWIELWNEPNNLSDWDWRLDPDWRIFSEMVGAAAYWARQRGKKTVLGGMAPTDPNWLRLMGDRGVLDYIDVVGIHGFPGTWDFDWQDWPVQIAVVQSVLDQFNLSTRIWITEAGFSTWRHDEFAQVREFVAAIAAPVDRIYWYAAQDLAPTLPTKDGLYVDVRDYHMGLKRADGTTKLLYRLWERGLAEVHAIYTLGKPQPMQYREQRPVLITGGAGFIGTNLAHRLLQAGQSVHILDNLSRPGVEANLKWLLSQPYDRLHIQLADVRDTYVVQEAVTQADSVVHLAAQVAVTTSLHNPRHDFDVNLYGTLCVLEALRSLDRPPSLIFTSTNKVYGSLSEIALQQRGDRDEPVELNAGVAEDQPLAFQSPYGCSKGAAEQYVLDYANTFGLPAMVFRMSCIYGPHQCGTEDQGWIAHFLKQAIAQQPIWIYGDGRQVRDVLFVDDLVDGLLIARSQISALSGRAFNIGGGRDHSMSLLELIALIECLHHHKLMVRFAQPRPGDQRYYVSDFSRFAQATGWQPRVGVREGVMRLHRWLCESTQIQDAVMQADPNSWQGTIAADSVS